MPDKVIELKFTGLDKQVKRLRRFQDVVEDPAMDPVIRDIAQVWRVNFDTEGGKVGGWRELAEMTQQVRQQRGFNPEHPILEQTGGLRHVAIDSLIRIRSSGSRNADGASMRLTIGKAAATLYIEGRKVSNQFRARVRGRGGFSRPPRRFWYVDDEVRAAAHRGLRKGILKEMKEFR